MDRRTFVKSCGVASASLLGPGTAGAQEREYLARADEVISRGRFQDAWESLSTYTAPQWYRDAKFGIFIHWGVYSVPAYENEWYPRKMYLRGSRAFWRHRRKYGPQHKFGYKDFIPLFRAEKFDPAAWIELFKKAGARYVVPVAEHHDGFPMYDCALSPWNALQMGPKRDIIGELARAAKNAGLAFGVSSHRAEHWWFMNGGRKIRSDVNDPQYESLYGPAMPRDLPPSPAYMDNWLARCIELVERHDPSLFYFDWWIEQPAFEPYRKKFAAYLYNRAAERGVEPVLNYKNQAFPETAAVLDRERSGSVEIGSLPWQTDTSVSYISWGYINPSSDIFKDPGKLIGDLADTVSKNGSLLLNVGPAPDGTIPDEPGRILTEIGRWLEINGEAIYGTRPWKIFGEGPTQRKTNKLYSVGEILAPRLTSRDVRYTVKGDALYALVMGWPPDRRVTLKSLGRKSGLAAGEISSIRLLGLKPQNLQFKRGDDSLEVSLPAEKPGDHAIALDIRGVRDRP